MTRNANDREAVTLSTATIHNPDEPRHFMRVKPAGRQVRVLVGTREIARSDRALRLLEVGKDVYDPVLYFPADDVLAALQPVDGKRTHCPLKGYAAYFDLPAHGDQPAVAEIAWSYRETLPFAAEIRDRVAFYGTKVTIEERPLG